jgi:glutamate racemase
VVDIIDFGVKMIYDKLLACENSKVLILGTPTTIDSEAHRAALLKLGIDSSRIVAQSCPALAGEIEKNPQSSEVETLIAKYVKSARAQMKITSDTQLFAALCCTHYGYSQEVFQSRLDQLFEQRVIILNPNIKMSEECLPESSRSYPAAAINLKIVSRIQLDQSKITAISGILVKTSPLVADALNHYHYDEELFRLK